MVGSAALGNDGAHALVAQRGSGGRFVIGLTGEWDLYNRPELDAALDTAIASAEPTIVLDLSQATFIDSSIVGSFVRARQAVEGGSIQVVIVANGTSVHRTLELMGVGRLFPTYERLEDVAA